MMDLNTIHAMSNSHAEHAEKFREVPFTIWPADPENWRQGENLPIPFPHIGDYVPSGFELDGEPWMIDTSGFGAPDEPALTPDQMLDKLEPGKAYAFVETGQFQAYLQQYKRCGT